MPDFTRDAATIHYELVGTGKPLLLIAGTASDGASWGPLLERLPGRQLILIDNRGSGRTKVEGPLSHKDMVEDCAALIEHLREHGRGAISRMKEEVQRRPVVARRGPAIGAAEDDRRLILAEVEVGEERDKGATVARDAAEMEGVVPRIVAVREPFGVAHDGRNGRGLAH